MRRTRECRVTPGFNAERVGPGGLLDDGKYLFFDDSDTCNGTLYRLPDTGGPAAHGLKTKAGVILAFVNVGSRCYAAR